MRFYEDKKQQEAYLKGIRDERPVAFQDGFNKALNECAKITAVLLTECRTCPLNCNHATYQECEVNLKNYILMQMGVIDNGRD